MELYHHGILGQKWGIRRYQNEDGTLTDAGRKRLDKKDDKWATKNESKITNKVYKKSSKEISSYVKNDLNKTTKMYNANGKISSTYINQYNRKVAEIMNKNVGTINSPSGRVVQFVAKRGDVGVYMALADQGYNINQLKNGVWDSGKVAYKNQNVEMAR